VPPVHDTGLSRSGYLVTRAAAVPPVATSDRTAPRPLVTVIGNPNVGKTALFNHLTGQNARVGNYPGVTVDRTVGTLVLGAGSDARTVDVVDVPGAYSLSARSAEEQITLEAVLGLDGNPRPDLALVVIDAGQLVRNLYLTLQVLELGVPVVVALNMVDEVAEPPSAAALAELLGVPVVATNARRGDGIPALRVAIDAALRTQPRGRLQVAYPDAVRRDVTQVVAALPNAWRSSAERDEALALWALTSIEPTDELRAVDPTLRATCLAIHANAGLRDIDQEIIAARYARLEAGAAALLPAQATHQPKRGPTARVDAFLLHPVYGLVIFLGLMLVLFQALFAWADPTITLIEAAIAWLQELVTTVLPAGVLTDLLSQGILGGVGNVIVFLPQILLLFLFMTALEDSGYMARVAFLMDRIMRALGLHGRAFVPMLSGLACAVPAILATRTMERQRDRLLTMLVVPLMTCSARLPVYTLIIGALFPPTSTGGLPVQGLLMVAMYVFSILVTLAATFVLGRTVVRGPDVPLILELPPYRMPSPWIVLRTMRDRAGDFLREAGTIILCCTIVLWALLAFPRSPDLSTRSPIAASYGGRLGHAIEPVIAPLGFDWKIGIGLIGSFAAREVFVSTMGLIYGIDHADDDDSSLRDQLRAERQADGRPTYTPLVGLSLMVFFALACQCMSTLAVTRRETRTWRWPAFMLVYMNALAWVASFVVYQGGRWLGF
jgi:ferrous iron transport protein B